MKQQTRLQNANDSMSFSQIQTDMYTRLSETPFSMRSKSALTTVHVH